jgi:DNA-binding transcriptional MerR regulator
MTVTELARACGLSRSTVLYYESIGLLRQVRRTAGNYRAYGEPDLERLRLICVYRTSGLKLADIRGLLDRPQHDAAAIPRAAVARDQSRDRTPARARTGHRPLTQSHRQTKEKQSDHETKMDRYYACRRTLGRRYASLARGVRKIRTAEHQEFLEFLHIPRRK